jgi:RNA polymerase sigma-70 factor (ECF subfamily)
LVTDGENQRRLIEAARDGDRRAQEALVRLHEGKIYGHILRLVRNTEDARDILQETMVRALTQLHQFDPAHSFAGWLYRIATNKALDFLRRRKIEFKTFTYEEDVPIETVADGAAPGDEIIAERLTWEMVEACMESLDPGYRAVLFMRYKDGLAYKEIAEALEIPMGTVKVMLHRGRNELKRLVRKEVGGHEV